MMYLLVLGGLVLLFIGGEALVRGSVSVARKLNISELVIGLTLVGFGTSVPELVTSLQAVERNAVGIAVGNVVGSNIANILLVLGLAAIITPIVVHPRALARDGAIMIAATLLLCGLLWFDQFGRVAGFLLIALLISYLVFSLIADQRRHDATADLHKAEGESVEAGYGLTVGLLIAAAGLVGVVIGANLLVTGASTLARSFGISETVIGLSIVAVGTSLPELATSVVAAFRKRADVAIGNIIGSNIFNILGILGITALVRPFSVRGDAGAEAMAGDQPVSIIAAMDVGALVLSAGLLMLFVMTGRQIARWEGAVLLLGYALYMGMTFGLIPAVNLLPGA
ncbi:MAG: calcium/sodium antiporter [Hyphomonas sp.]|uniref:calcium/sodium antiporter n=1 Tax=Hyphomonas sp. TaxID=87 RepID=UPI0018421E3F|nr:calcium/sodium antiporter [Hyphomonas sp.]MBU3919731.1 calcium/sodium antiporter [Alphaproteobacteria bacterium]MBA3069760.1 calcium/sodium antiporter [Hyphomonas sp.]MBU4062601.1 calcium/sodium antiporter [Alphaproteobacteria bacterium]MBU4163952.1 calcium/sodium antiporter [Alphaproteobacteria bacterium]MBU4569437.1 calcium/sodium antiporter [Alphaproteobacteria bacterium]